MNPVRTATVFTHRRPSETGPRSRIAASTSPTTPAPCCASIRGDAQARARARRGARARRPGAPTTSTSASRSAATARSCTALRTYAGTACRCSASTSARSDSSRRSTATSRAAGFEARVRRRVRGAVAARRSASPGAASGGWRSTTSRCTASPASASPTSPTRSADDEVGRVRCDGLVVATPAGSTGYNLANGGPVMAWGVEGIVVSFIAPHSLTARALVVAPADVLTVHNRSHEEPVDVAVDGRPVGVLAPGEQVEARFVDNQGCAGADRRRDLLPAPAGEVRALASSPSPASHDRVARCDLCPTAGVDPSRADELRVENLLLMERAELRLAPGLNVLTGETGAGKTLLAHALDLLLGGRARERDRARRRRRGIRRGRVLAPARARSRDRRAIPDDAEELVLARRVWPDGRTRAYVCGRSATVADLRELGGAAARVLRPARAPQADALDGAARHARCPLRRRAAGAARADSGDLRARSRARASDRELRELAGARDRELDLLAFELDEIEAVDPSEDEERRLTAERDRLRHLETLRIAATTGAEAVSPDGAGGAARCSPRPSAARARGRHRPGADGALHAAPGSALRGRGPRRRAAPLRGRARGRRRCGRGRSRAPRAGRGAPCAVRAPRRKHGGAIADVLAHAERCRARRDELEHADVALESGEAELAAACAELDELAAGLHGRRTKAAPKLAEAVRERLAELAMPDASFEVALRDRPDGCGPRGADAVELMIAANPGVPAGPLREIASGGELSRVMLALLTVAHAQSGDGETSPLLVFDEIDAGIGGHTARAVGEHLRELAAGRQLLCITHLPQVAALASRHFTIAKSIGTVPAHDDRHRARRRLGRRRARADARGGGGRPRGQAARPPAAARGGLVPPPGRHRALPAECGIRGARAPLCPDLTLPSNVSTFVTRPERTSH